MIDPKELKLDNLILHKGEIVPVYQIERRYKTVYRINDIDVDERVIGDTYQPVPLTPELMPSCGFHRRPESRFYTCFNDKVLFESWPLDGSIVIEGGFVGQKIKHLHQLQNLYFALTGIELVVNLAKINS